MMQGLEAVESKPEQLRNVIRYSSSQFISQQ